MPLSKLPLSPTPLLGDLVLPSRDWASFSSAVKGVSWGCGLRAEAVSSCPLCLSPCAGVLGKSPGDPQGRPVHWLGVGF